MLNFLKTNEQIQETTKDTLGGGGFVWDTGVYPVTVELAFIGASASSNAVSANFEFKTKEGKKLKYTTWITNKDGQNYYVDKKDPSIMKYLPGFELLNELSLVTTGKEISETSIETKTIMKYNAELKKDAPTDAQVFMDLLGAELLIGVVKEKAFKQVKNTLTGAYEDTADIRETNEVNKVFTTTGFTVVELKAEVATPDFINKYTELYKADFVKDKTVGKKSTGTAGSGAQSATKSLFAKKA